ncbi:MAG: GIY-YIG nuclease family protein [Candidatus Margulisbacteria bacterium]|nr:GIY-YIG nuclease family protein [Candidatus Margulisiibacteriota bacterium]
MYSLYILESLKNGRYYIGVTGNLADRIKRHNSGECKSTKPNAPYEMIYIERYSTLKEARQRETELKSKKSRRYIEQLVRGS